MRLVELADFSHECLGRMEELWVNRDKHSKGLIQLTKATLQRVEVSWFYKTDTLCLKYFLKSYRYQTCQLWARPIEWLMLNFVLLARLLFSYMLLSYIRCTRYHLYFEYEYVRVRALVYEYSCPVYTVFILCFCVPPSLLSAPVSLLLINVVHFWALPKQVYLVKVQITRQEPCNWPASHRTCFWLEKARCTWFCLLCLAFNCFWRILSQSGAMH